MINYTYLLNNNTIILHLASMVYTYIIIITVHTLVTLPVSIVTDFKCKRAGVRAGQEGRLWS